MKIAMFTDAYFPRINGVSVSVHSFAEGLCKLGHEVCVVCLEYTEEQQKSSFFDEKSNDEKSPFKILRIPSAWIAFSREDRMARLDKWNFIKKSMDEFAPDVIHINSEWTIGYFGIIYSRHRHVPFVFTFHTLWEDYLSNYIHFLPTRGLKKIGMELVRFYLKRADIIIAPTKQIAEVVERYGIKRKVEIIPTGIPDSKIVYNEKKAKLVYSTLFKKFPGLKGKKILLFVGRIVKEKNLSFLFNVLKNVQAEIPKAALLFVGGGPYLDELKQISESRGLKNSVFFTGYIEGNDLIYFYRLASVFTFPSKTETQGLVTVEAMLSGLPVVAIGEMGTADVMQGDNGGFMVKDDTDEFTQKTLALLKDKKLHKEKSEQALEWGIKWKISSLTPRLIECYQNALSMRSQHSKKENTSDR
ncbi:glycosyltransferase [Treponema sp.]|uniref:glycosyltransferase n=1 Tax=Treponema sp. TaxID=166 RepID=UPI003F042B0E